MLKFEHTNSGPSTTASSSSNNITTPSAETHRCTLEIGKEQAKLCDCWEFNFTKAIGGFQLRSRARAILDDHQMAEAQMAS